MNGNSPRDNSDLPRPDPESLGPEPLGPEASAANGPTHKIGPWTRLSSRDIYENPWIKVREDQVLRPDGKPGIYGLVHFKNLAVGVVALDAQGRIVLVGQHRYPFDAYSWEIPEGGVLIGTETAEQGAQRELLEETGFSADRWDYLGRMELSNSATDETAHFFLARDLKSGQPNPDGTEELTVRLMDFKAAYQEAMEGVLTESLTVVALARAKYFLEREALRGHGQPQAEKPRGDEPRGE